MKLPIYNLEGKKTGKTIDALKNAGYEALSWVSPGSLPHLLRHYTTQADKYVVETSSKNFLHGLEKKVLQLPKPKKTGESLEKLAA